MLRETKAAQMYGISFASGEIKPRANTQIAAIPFSQTIRRRSNHASESGNTTPSTFPMINTSRGIFSFHPQPSFWNGDKCRWDDRDPSNPRQYSSRRFFMLDRGGAEIRDSQ